VLCSGTRELFAIVSSGIPSVRARFWPVLECLEELQCGDIEAFYATHRFTSIFDSILKYYVNTSYSSGHKLRPTNDPFCPHDYIRLVNFISVVQVFVFDRSIVKE
jgi:hypothetical protein